MRVKSVPHLIRLARECKSVFGVFGRSPAAFAVNMSAQVVQGWIDRKTLFVYVPKKKGKKAA